MCAKAARKLDAAKYSRQPLTPKDSSTSPHNSRNTPAPAPVIRPASTSTKAVGLPSRSGTKREAENVPAAISTAAATATPSRLNSGASDRPHSAKAASTTTLAPSDNVYSASGSSGAWMRSPRGPANSEPVNMSHPHAT